VTWDDVGGLNLIRKVFDLYIVQRIKHPEHYEVNFLVVRTVKICFKLSTALTCIVGFIFEGAGNRFGSRICAFWPSWLWQNPYC
jgi:hypothetical protein